MTKSNKSAVYGASSIKQLEGLEAVRKRPGMYIGSTSERGLHHMITEVVDNSVDEAMAGYATYINVTLLADGGVEVIDDGRGIPVEMHEKGIPTVQLVLTSLHAGGKFDSDSYAVSGGLHGVGISVVNALSSRVEVEIERDGYHWSQHYVWNNKIQGVDASPLEKGIPSRKTGTTVRFWADPTVFEVTHYDYNTVAKRLQEMAFLNKGLKISLTDKRVEDTFDIDITDESATDVNEINDIENIVQTVTFHYPNGLVDFVKYINRNKKPILENIIGFTGVGLHHEVEIALQWNDSYSESIFTFANTINTHEGGTHEEGFKAALTYVVNKYARERKLLKEKEENFTGDDVREGLAGVISVKVSEPQFEGQTKTKLGNTEIKSFVQKVCNEQLGHWFEANPNEARIVINKALQSAQARLAARKARELVRKKGPADMTGWTGKLADCRSKDPQQCEIFIVEGDSAGGSARAGRDSMYQAILSIRGKIINVEKARIDKVLKNTEVQSIIGSFGTGIHEEFDLSRLRYYKIILMADADVDGQHISTLLLTLLFRFMKPLVEHGHVYLAQPPLYKLKWLRGVEPEYAYSDRERDVLLQAGLDSGKHINTDDGIQRYKGLGEMNPKELWETTMDPTVRVLKQITMEDAAAADDIFSILMGEDVSARKHFITKNANDVRFLDV